jgi:hypothetical protein
MGRYAPPTYWHCEGEDGRSEVRNQKLSYKKKQWRPPSKKKKRGKNLSPRNRKACHSIDVALPKSVAEVGTQSAMKSSRKTLHIFTSHIPPKRRKGTEIEIEIVYNMNRMRRFTPITVCAGWCLWALPTVPYKKLTNEG